MDKLKKVLVYQFWILLGIAILLPIVTWFIFSGKLMADASSREAAIKGVWDALPKGETPNNDWNAQVTKRNEEQTIKVSTAWQKIWDIQKSRMTWPDDLAGMVDPLKATTTELELYRSRYLDEVRSVWRLANPIIFEEKIGNVDFPFELVLEIAPKELVNSTLPPTPQQMKDAQEDLWLLSSLFRGIADTNEGALTINDAPVRQVQGIKLMGGTPRAPGGAAPPPPGGEGGGAAGSGNGAGDGGFSSAMGGRMMMGGGGTADQVDFDPRDEFGPDDLAGAGGQMGGESSAGSAMPGSSGMPGGFGGMGATVPRKRYIDENPKWKTRGFYLKVVVDHRRLPDFLVQLTNRSWPVKITRVHQVDLLPEDLATPDGSTPATAGAGGGAFGGGGGMPGNSAIAGHGGPVGRMPGSGFGGGSAAGHSADGGGMGFGRPRFGGGESSAGSAIGGGAFGGGFAGGTPAGGDPNNPTSAAAMNDPMLAIVAISGVITIYNPPTADPAAQPAGQQPGQTPPGTAPPADPNATTPPAATTTEGTAPAVPAATTPAATTTPADASTTAPPATTGTAPPAEGAAPAAAPTTPATPPAATAPGGAATPPPAEKLPGT